MRIPCFEGRLTKRRGKLIDLVLQGKVKILEKKVIKVIYADIKRILLDKK